MSCDDCTNGCATGVTKDIEEVPITPFQFVPMFRTEHATSTPWMKMPYERPVEVVPFQGREILLVRPEILHQLAYDAICDIQHYYRREHLQFLRNILEDVEASPNDKFVALSLLKNACISARRVLPSCQDTGTAIVFGKKGECVMTGCNDEEEFSRGVWKAYQYHNFRYSQMAPVDMFKEVNTKTNLPAQVDISAIPGEEYKLMFMAKGGGSANKSFLFQKTKAVLTPKALVEFLEDKLEELGTSACPPYHIAVVIGGLSAEMCLKTVKLASCRYYDDLPRTGDGKGGAFRDIEWEEEVLKITRECNIGAQFGGKYFAHQIRVIRMPRHGASCPIGIGVSCSADRQILAKITRDGVYLEELVKDPTPFLPEVPPATKPDQVVDIDLSMGMDRLRSVLSEHPIKTRLALTGTIVVARDIAHSKLAEELQAGKPLPQYMKDHIVYYAGPAKTPAGTASGSFGPTTAGRMDVYLAQFMAAGGSFITLAKGNRSQEVTDACRKFRGFYLGSIGGPAALLAEENIKKVEVLAYPELGMEAIYRIEVVNFPAFIVVDDKGNDFFKSL
jgi:fumarate hydratase class I